MIKLTECPRDAMQGLHQFVPTDVKATYINLLLQVGFDTIDFGSFVSPKAIPQLKDTQQVLDKLNLSSSRSKLLAIVANYRGMQDAVKQPPISYLGYPFSVSETFQLRNTNSTIAQSLTNIEELVEICNKHNKCPIVYLSMGFGNPYGDEWSYEIVANWMGELVNRGVTKISIADTIGISTPETINYLFSHLVKHYPEVELGVHLHSAPLAWEEKINAAYRNGCQRFDTALRGYGGCPMAANDLVGNIATENVMSYLENKGEDLKLNLIKWQEAINYSGNIFR